MLELLLLLASGAVGAAIARLLKLPMWAITGAILGSACANMLLAAGTSMPLWLTFSAQVLVGTAVGASVRPGLARQLGALITPAVIIVLSVVVVAISGSVVLAFLGIVEPREAVLGMLPGGVGEMVAASASIGADSALVAGIHLVRLLIIIWTLPLLLRWASTWKRRGEPDGSEPAPAG
jgi:membrane AbrB-like protein